MAETPGNESSIYPPMVADSRLLNVLTILVIVVLVSLGTWCGYAAEHRNDQYQLLHLGQCVHDGGTLYEDCWENKPPGMAWLHTLALTVSGGRVAVVWILPGVLCLAALLVFRWSVSVVLSAESARRLVILASFVVTLRVYDAPAINPDSYAASIELAAISFWMVGLTALASRAAWGWSLFAGVCWSAATAVKQPGIAGLLAVMVLAAVLVLRKHLEKERWVRAAVAAVIGFGVGLAGVVAALAFQGTLREAWYAIVSFNQSEVQWGALAEIWQSRHRLRSDLQPLHLPIWAAIAGCVMIWFGRSAGKFSKPACTLLLTWWALAGAFALVSPSRSMRYWQAIFPPILWLGAAGAMRVQDAFRRLPPGYRSPFTVISLTAVVLLARPFLEEYRFGVDATREANRTHPTEHDQLDDWARQVTELVPKGESIYIWAYQPGLYVFSGRRAACRFNYPRSESQMKEILETLRSSPPRLLLVPNRPAQEFRRFCNEECNVQLDRILAEYAAVKAIGPYETWVRRGSANVTPSPGPGPAIPPP